MAGRGEPVYDLARLTDQQLDQAEAVCAWVEAVGVAGLTATEHRDLVAVLGVVTAADPGPRWAPDADGPTVGARR